MLSDPQQKMAFLQKKLINLAIRSIIYLAIRSIITLIISSSPNQIESNNQRILKLHS